MVLHATALSAGGFILGRAPAALSLAALRPIEMPLMGHRGLRVLLFQKLPGIWVARGLEHDLAVEGRSPQSVIDRIHRLVRAHAAFDRRHGRAPLSPFPAAPLRFWRAFERAAPLPALEESAGEAQFGPITVAISSEDRIASIPGSPYEPPPKSGARRSQPVH